MPKQKVYISSTFRDLKDYRQTLINLFQNQLKNNFELCKIMERMFDDGSYGPFTEECSEAVAQSDIYIIILGNKVGSFPPNETRTYTEIEFDTAIATHKKIFFLRYTTFNENEIDNKEKHQEILKKFEGRPSHLFQDIKEFQNAFLLNIYQFFPSNNDKINYDEIYFCDRSIQSRDFNIGLMLPDVIQFHLISCHNRDYPETFIKRKQMEFEEIYELKMINLIIEPKITENDNYDTVEEAIIYSIIEKWNKHEVLKNFGFKFSENFNIEKAFKVLAQTEFTYFMIAWKVKGIYWKNDNLKNHIGAFYEKYKSFNKNYEIDKKVLFIGLACYTEDSGMTKDEFDKKIDEIKYGSRRPIRLTKIQQDEIQTWVNDYVDDNPDEQEKILTKYNLKNKNGFFMAELIEPLNKILQEADKY